MSRDEVVNYVRGLSDQDCRAQLHFTLFKLQTIRLAPSNAHVGAVLELADHATEVEFG